jgi:hypothetical protein
MGFLPQKITDYFSAEVIRAYKAPLVGPNLIARGEDIPPGVGTLTRNSIQNFTGKAKRGYKIREVPRESSEGEPRTVKVIEHTYGFKFHKQTLDAYQRMGVTALNGEDARQSGRIVSESLDDVIFNGDANRNVKGLYKDASATPLVLDDGKAWNQAGTTNAPDDTIVEAVGMLASTQLYTGLSMKLALDPLSYGQLLRRVPNTGSTYLDFIARIPQFKNGVNDIYQTTGLATGCGLLEYFGTDVAERNVEWDINTFPVQQGMPDKDNMIYYNTETYQAQDIFHTDAIMQLRNLYDAA